MNQQDIRAELAAMTDDEVLAWARRKYANPYMNLNRAKEVRSFTFRWMHDTAAAMLRKHQDPERAMRALRVAVLGE